MQRAPEGKHGGQKGNINDEKITFSFYNNLTPSDKYTVKNNNSLCLHCTWNRVKDSEIPHCMTMTQSMTLFFKGARLNKI